MQEGRRNSIPKDMQDIWDLAENYSYPAERGNEDAWAQFEQKSQSKVRRMTWVKYAAAAVILVVCSVFTYTSLSSNEASEPQIFATTFSQFETVALEDGSSIEIAPNSILQVQGNYGNKTRTVSLKGQAKFTVIRDEDCPFIVESENLTTTVLGTVFEVRSDNRNQQVVVHSGTVKVNADKEEVLLTKNQSASYVNKTLSKELIFDLNNWNGVNKSLKYENATLAQIKDDIKAITGRTLVIPEDKLDEKFTGKFENSGDVASICKVLSMAFEFEVTAI